MTEQEIKQDYKMFTQCWRLYKKYAGIQQVDDNTWNLFLKETGELYEDFKNSPMLKVLWGTQKAIDELWTKREKIK